MDPMNITVNGEPRQVPEQCTVAQLIDMLGLGNVRIAVEVNLEIVPRGTHAKHVLQEGDRVEVVRAIGGGSF